jgi:hypothetical protein
MVDKRVQELNKLHAIVDEALQRAAEKENYSGLASGEGKAALLEDMPQETARNQNPVIYALSMSRQSVELSALPLSLAYEVLGYKENFDVAGVEEGSGRASCFAAIAISGLTSA